MNGRLARPFFMAGGLRDERASVVITAQIPRPLRVSRLPG